MLYRRYKKLFHFLFIAITIVVAVVALSPTVNRLQDNADKHKVNTAFITLLNEIGTYKSQNQNKALELSDIKNLLAQKDNLKNLRHPQTKEPYQVKLIDPSEFINGPENQKFLNYDGLDGTSFYFGLGICRNPGADQSSFLAFSIEMKRTGEAHGRCKEL